MKASELISQLKCLMSDHGDVECLLSKCEQSVWNADIERVVFQEDTEKNYNIVDAIIITGDV